MKINNLRSTNPPVITDREGIGKTERTAGGFSADLAKQQDNLSQERLNALMEQIDAQGKKLGQVPTYAELKAYRELVRNFLGEVVGRAYTLQSQAGWDRHGRQKMYSIIKEIDQQMSSLAEDVRFGQERQLAIMERLDAIRGMLVDLYS